VSAETRQTRASKAKPRPVAGPRFVSAGEVYPLPELTRRLGWGEHALRQARRAGLRVIAFGRCKYVLGSDVVDFFHRLASPPPAGNGDGAGRGMGERT